MSFKHLKNRFVKWVKEEWIPLSISILSFPLFLTLIDQQKSYQDVIRYFFSSAAQTMGALLAIVLTALYVILPNLKSSDDPAAESLKRLLLSDSVMSRSIKFGSIMILISLIFISTSANQCISSHKWLIAFLLSFDLSLGVFSFWYLIVFITKRYNMYSNPYTLVQYEFEQMKGFLPKKLVDLTIINFFNAFQKKIISKENMINIFNCELGYLNKKNKLEVFKMLPYQLALDSKKHHLSSDKYQDECNKIFDYIIDKIIVLRENHYLEIFRELLIIYINNITDNTNYFWMKMTQLTSELIQTITNPQISEDSYKLISIFLKIDTYLISKYSIPLFSMDQLEDIKDYILNNKGINNYPELNSLIADYYLRTIDNIYFGSSTIFINNRINFKYFIRDKAIISLHKIKKSYNIKVEEILNDIDTQFGINNIEYKINSLICRYCINVKFNSENLKTIVKYSELMIQKMQNRANVNLDIINFIHGDPITCSPYSIFDLSYKIQNSFQTLNKSDINDSIMFGLFFPLELVELLLKDSNNINLKDLIYTVEDYVELLCKLDLDKFNRGQSIRKSIAQKK